MKRNWLYTLLGFLVFGLAACGTDDVSKAPTGNNENNTNNVNNVNNINNLDDAGPSDMGTEDMQPDPSCDDGVVNQDETDVDCGGSCDPCELGSTCQGPEDCASAVCSDDGVCIELGQLGEICETNAECESDQCQAFGDESRCTQPCEDTCPGAGLACFRDLCTPSTYCEDPDEDGFGEGPGCQGTPCDRCSDDATCNSIEDNQFECVCNEGFEGDGLECNDIDECELELDTCDENADCTNIPGSYECDCSMGYIGDGETCMDIDECADGSDTCDPNATCSNEVPGFSCTCLAGFEGDGMTCADIDECDRDLDNCSPLAGCINQPGGFACGSCPAGYNDVNGDGTSCVDINECDAGTAACDAAAECINLEGSYECGPCPSGYIDVNGDGTQCDDINECASGAANCDDPLRARCINEPGSFSCECRDGWTGDGETCTDINECTDDSDDCHGNAFCTNLPGSFACTCNSGFTGDGVNSCANVDECASDSTNQCDPNATCQDLIGTYTCDCNDGWRGNGFTCTNIDECSEGSDNCDENATCTDEPGSFTCACDDGYVGDGVDCDRIGSTCGLPFVVDPSALPFTNSANTDDATNDYSFSSGSCPGVGSGWGGGSPDDAYEFTPTVTGSYVIRAETQFDSTLYVVTDCDDVDGSCLQGVDGDFNSSENVELIEADLTAGETYFIIVDGYTNTSSTSGAYTIFIDEDPCVGASTCGPGGTCSPTFPGFECTCVDGYEDDGGSCVDIDECTELADPCPDPNATCTNEPGTYTCECDDGFSGDRETCWPDSTLGENCTNPFVISTLPYTTSGDTSDAHNDFSFSAGECPGTSLSGGGNAPDETYSFTPATTGDYQFQVSGTDFDSVIYMVTDCSDVGGTCLQADDAATSGATETIDVSLTAGTTYYFVVDGWSSGEGVYTLDVTCTSCP